MLYLFKKQNVGTFFQKYCSAEGVTKIWVHRLERRSTSKHVRCLVKQERIKCSNKVVGIFVLNVSKNGVYFKIDMNKDKSNVSAHTFNIITYICFKVSYFLCSLYNYMNLCFIKFCISYLKQILMCVLIYTLEQTYYGQIVVCGSNNSF